MSARYCDLDDKGKSACKVDDDPSDEAWLYCDTCHRAMHQGDCPVEEGGEKLDCAYPDCDLGGNLAYRSLYGWDAYKKARPVDTAKWPQDPIVGTRYF